MLAFEFGAFGPLFIRRERVVWDLPAPVRLLYASDLHLGYWWTSPVCESLLDAARAARPDLVLLGGDLVDGSWALPRLSGLVAALAGVAPVWAVPGNHDDYVGTAAVRRAVVSAGGHWLAEEPVEGPVRIEGAVNYSTSRGRILCGHDPAVFPEAVAAGYGLVLAGHLHGGQCVLATRRGRQYPAAWLHRWHGLRFEEGGATLLVSRGAADTLPFRFNCPREVILCELGPPS
jgi:predicted MPP superfamily phosphohydrolase